MAVSDMQSLQLIRLGHKGVSSGHTRALYCNPGDGLVHV